MQMRPHESGCGSEMYAEAWWVQLGWRNVGMTSSTIICQQHCAICVVLTQALIEHEVYVYAS
jgi:hypothetical protein